MIILFIFAILYAISDAYHDYLVIDRELEGWHSVDAFIKTLVALFIALLSYFDFIKFEYETSFYIVVPCIIFIILGIRWIVFDLSLNLFRGKKWYYIGETSNMDKKIGSWQYPIKFVVIILLILIYFS